MEPENAERIPQKVTLWTSPPSTWIILDVTFTREQFEEARNRNIDFDTEFRATKPYSVSVDTEQLRVQIN